MKRERAKRISTGVPDLDLVLGGGLSPGSVIIIAGEAGTGKTILAQQICFANATREHKAVYYTTLSEPHSKLVENLQEFTFFDPSSLGPMVEYIHLGDLLRSGGEAGLEPMVSEVVRKAFDERPAIVVVDSIRLLREFTTERGLREALYDLTSRMAQTGTVLLLLCEFASEEIRSGAEFALADGIIQMSYQAREPIDRRWLRVIKMRGRSHREGKHTFRISSGGIDVFARLETLVLPEVLSTPGRIVSGIPGLDKIMGDGIPKSDATLVMGPSGVGKTIFSLGYIAQGLAEGERCLYITFQDTADQLVGMAAGFGWDFHSARARDQLAISHVPMGTLDLDVLASVVNREVRRGPISRVVIDSLAELVLSARELDRFPAYLRSLNALVRSFGASLLFTSETTTLGPIAEPLDGLMFLFHNVIQIRYVERPSDVGRVLNVLKMRNSRHDSGIHSCTIMQDGLTVGDNLDGITGVLGWSALRQT